MYFTLSLYKAQYIYHVYSGPCIKTTANTACREGTDLGGKYTCMFTFANPVFFYLCSKCQRASVVKQSLCSRSRNFFTKVSSSKEAMLKEWATAPRPPPAKKHRVGRPEKEQMTTKNRPQDQRPPRLQSRIHCQLLMQETTQKSTPDPKPEVTLEPSLPQDRRGRAIQVLHHQGETINPGRGKAPWTASHIPPLQDSRSTLGTKKKQDYHDYSQQRTKGGHFRVLDKRYYMVRR